MARLWIDRQEAGMYTARVGDERYCVVRHKRRGWWSLQRWNQEAEATKSFEEVAVFASLVDADLYVRALPVLRRNIMSGKEFYERADTPYYCSPSSETYWCS
jgi:hypothetical protein